MCFLSLLLHLSSVFWLSKIEVGSDAVLEFHASRPITKEQLRKGAIIFTGDGSLSLDWFCFGFMLLSGETDF